MQQGIMSAKGFGGRPDFDGYTDIVMEVDLSNAERRSGEGWYAVYQ